MIIVYLSCWLSDLISSGLYQCENTTKQNLKVDFVVNNFNIQFYFSNFSPNRPKSDTMELSCFVTPRVKKPFSNYNFHKKFPKDSYSKIWIRKLNLILVSSFQARFISKSEKDSLRELHGFFFVVDAKLCLYEYRNFGKTNHNKNVTLILNRKNYNYNHGRRKNEPYEKER